MKMKTNHSFLCKSLNTYTCSGHRTHGAGVPPTRDRRSGPTSHFCPLSQSVLGSQVYTPTFIVICMRTVINSVINIFILGVYRLIAGGCYVSIINFMFGQVFIYVWENQFFFLSILIERRMQYFRIQDNDLGCRFPCVCHKKIKHL